MSNIAKVQPQEMQADPMISMIERVALDPNSGIEKLERMLDMQERINAQNAKSAFNRAFAAAASEFKQIPLNGRGNNNKPYALLKDIISGTRDALSAHGLALSFSADTQGDRVIVTAELMHVDGHSKTTAIDLPRDKSGSKNEVQAVGSSLTYGERYAAQAILGLSLGDDTEDDGKSAGGNLITADQFIRLQGLMEEADADAGKMLAYLKASALEELTVKQFDTACAALKAKIANRGEA